MYENCDIGHDLKMAFEDGYRAGLEAAQPKWISVDERLPGYNAGMRFIVSRDDGTVKEGRFEVSNGRWYELTAEGLWKIEVTHWMPMPDSPKEDA